MILSGDISRCKIPSLCTSFNASTTGFIKIVGKKVRSFEYLPLLTRAEYVAQTRGHLLNGNEGASLSDFVVAMQKLGRCNAADLEKLAETVKLLRG